MAVTEFHCINSADDGQLGDGASNTVTVMLAQFENFLVLESWVKVFLDTSAIGTDDITAATDKDIPFNRAKVIR